MEQRAAIPPGLPKANPTISYWQDPPSRISTHRTTSSLNASASTIIIGSGITGAMLAYTLLSHHPLTSVVMLEARTACSGATGRNGGHTKCASYRSFLDNVRALGEEEAAKIVRFEYNCMKAVHALARVNGIDCDSWEGDTVDIIYDEGQWRLANEAIREIQRVLGKEDPASKYRFWSAEEANRVFLTQGAVGAVTYEAGSLSGYKFGTGVLQLALEKGLNLQTETPALRIEKEGQGWVVETSRGSIKSDRVVLATNGYTAHLYPALQGTIVPLRGIVTAHRPGSRMPKEGLTTTYSFIYDDGYEYMISRPPGSKHSGDIVIGGGLTKAAEGGLYEYGTVDDIKVDPAIISYLRGSTPKYFGVNWGEDDEEGRVRKEWSGIMGYSGDGFPMIGEVPDESGLFIAASFQGHGMVLCLSSAKAMASIINQDDEEALDQWFPKCFKLTKERMKNKFQGRLHTTAPADLEVKSQV